MQSACLSFADNTGKEEFSLRLTQLSVTAPVALTDPTVKNIIRQGITYDYPECQSSDGFSFFDGDGTFNWLLEVDRAAGTLRTGGAALQTDPEQGYCFLEQTIGAFAVEPLVADIQFSGNSFSTSGEYEVVVPVFTDPNDTSNVILLPLKGVKILDAELSEDNNCIGSFNGANLSPNNLCLPSTEVSSFVDSAKLEGYITLEDADDVLVPVLQNASLCTLIAGFEGTDQETKTCKRDAGEIVFKGDWCASSNSEATADCYDAMRLSATFSAAGATLSSGCP